MYERDVRELAVRLLSDGHAISTVSRRLGVHRSTLRSWRDHGTTPRRLPACFVCESVEPPRPEAYAALLGFYLGDGCLSHVRRSICLRISCDAAYPGIVQAVHDLIEQVRPERGIAHVTAPGVVVVAAYWKHWPCLFPQHGPGRKHERTLVLAPWQREIVEAHPAAFLRGLFHSDGCRSRNWASRMVAGERRRYAYPRWQFVNNSADIRRWCGEALDLVGVPWRQSGWKTLSVSTREGVATLDRLVGKKS